MGNLCFRRSSLLSSGLLVSMFAAQASALTLDPLSAPLCFGAGYAEPTIADVVTTSPGAERLVTVLDEIVKADADVDGRNEVLAELVVKAVDRSGGVLWRSAKLAVKSADVATAVPPANLYILPTLEDQADLVLSFGGLCLSTFFGAEHGGQQYVVVVAGYLAQEGTLLAGTDYSKVFVWVLNRETGAVVKKHKLLARANKYLVGASLEAFADLDKDNNDELIAAWAIPTGGGKYTVLFESYDLLSGALEDRSQVFTRKTLAFE